MEIKTEKLPKSRIRLIIKISPIQMGEYFARALEKLAADFTLPGFRPGKAPLSLVEQKIGQDRISAEALEIALPLTYQEAIKKEQLHPIEPPKVEIKEFGHGKPFIYKAEVDLMPEIELADYHRLKIQNPKSKIQITDEEIETTLKQLQKQTANLKPVDRPAKKGDWVEIDFESFSGDKPLPAGKSQNHPLVIGQGQFVPQFEEKLIGMKKNEEKKFSVKFPPDFHNKEIAGKEVSFRVLVREIKEIELPEINDSWAVQFGKKDLKDLKNSIKESLKKEAEKKEEERLEQEMIEKVVSSSKVELPESLILAEISRIYQNLLFQVENKGLKFENYLKNLKKTQDELLADLRKPAEQNVKASLVLGAIKDREKIAVSEKEISEEIKKLEEQKIEIKDKEDKKRIENILGIRKTVERLKGLVFDTERPKAKWL